MPTAVSRHKTYPAIVNDVVRLLQSAGKQFGTEYYLVLANTNPDAAEAARNPDKAYEVATRSSKHLFDLHIGQDFGWRVPGVIRSSKQQAGMATQRSLGFHDLGTPLLRRVAKEVLVTAIRNKAKQFPFRDASSEDVAGEYAWYPATIAWRSTDKWQRTELLQLIDSLGSLLDTQQLRDLSAKVMLKVDTCCNAYNLEQISKAFEQLERGDTAPVQPALTGAATTVDLALDIGWLLGCAMPASMLCRHVWRVMEIE